jgi:hypothetical protein
MVIIAAVIGFIGSILSQDTINIYYPSEQIAITPTIEATNEARLDETKTATPEVDLTVEVTTEQTPELEVDP